MSFKLSDIQDQHDAPVELVHPTTRAPLGARITLAGPEHPKRRGILAERARRIRRRLEKSGKLKLDDPEVEEQERIELLAACTLGWDGLLGDDDKPLPFSEAAAVELYRGCGWIRGQMEAAFDDRELFYQGLVEHLIDWAKQQFALDRDAGAGDGSTVREHLQAAYRMSGRLPDELDIDPLPEALDWLWQTWRQIAEGRQGSGFGPLPITWRDMRDWCELMHMSLTPWEVGAIRLLDRVFLQSHAAKGQKHDDQDR